MTQYDDIIVTPNYGPLSHQYPSAMPVHDLGTLPGRHPNPPQFYSQQEPVYSDQFVNSRHIYARTARTRETYALERANAIRSPINTFYSFSGQRHYPVSTHMNYIAPIDTSLYINRKKAIAVGKSSYKQGLPAEALYTTKNYYPSGVRTSIRRVRSGGCVAPKKKGAIENTSLRNGQVCAWGSLPRQNY